MTDYKEWWCEKFNEIKEENPHLTEEQISKEVDNSFGDLIDTAHETYKDKLMRTLELIK